MGFFTIYSFLEVSLALGSLCRLHNMNTDLQQRAARIELLQRAMQDLQYQIDQKDDKIKDLNCIL
jgi:peptidoglycan hydrolase CwlO-like protein